ncbi:MAG: radical SAM protein [Spirochaetota bacterium]
MTKQSKVLIISGGLLSSQETSFWEVGKRLLMQWRHSQAAWLDLKVKLVVAEPLVYQSVYRLPKELAQLSKNLVIQEATGIETPNLTEVVLSTLLEKLGMPFELLHIDSLFSEPQKAQDLLERCECVFLSTTYLHDLSELDPILKRIKTPHNRVIVGGALSGILADNWEGSEEIDLVAVGSGELIYENIVTWIRSGYQEVPPPSKGQIISKKHSLFLYSGELASDRSLDFLPTPDWRLAEKYHQTQYKTIHYESVRGCPYRCAFCNYPYLFNESRFRYKSAEKMYSEWEFYAKETGAETIVCLDSLFTIPRERLVAFCKLLIKNKLDLRWSCYARTDDLAQENIVALMKEAGLQSVQIGLESGSPQILKNMRKSTKVEYGKQALRNCRKHGVMTATSIIVGFPGETEATLEETYQFLKESQPDFYFLALFSTRVTSVPILNPSNRKKFGISVMENRHSMAPYWTHASMSCLEAMNHLRSLDHKLMKNQISLNAALFYRYMSDFDLSYRDALLKQQKYIIERPKKLRRLFDKANAWIDKHLEKDLSQWQGTLK